MRHRVYVKQMLSKIKKREREEEEEHEHSGVISFEGLNFIV